MIIVRTKMHIFQFIFFSIIKGFSVLICTHLKQLLFTFFHFLSESDKKLKNKKKARGNNTNMGRDGTAFSSKLAPFSKIIYEKEIVFFAYNSVMSMYFRNTS